MQNLQDDALKIFCAGVEAVAPKKLVADALKISGNKLVVKDKEYLLNHNLYVVAFGKAVLGMIQAVESLLDSHIVQGVASIPWGTHVVNPDHRYETGRIQKIEIIEGAKNNFPDENALRAARKIMEIAENVEQHDILLVLVSGGGSALLPMPVSEITLQEKLQTTKLLANKGASIVELNTVRKHLSQIKGGKLAQVAYPASVITLILSDVLGDPLDVIACGPTVYDSSTKKDCFEIIEKLNIRHDLPSNVITYLNNEDEAKEDSRKTESFCHVNNVLVGNNTVAVDGASAMARNLGYHVIIHNTCVSGEARNVGRLYASLKSEKGNKSCVEMKGKQESRKAVCIIGAGETTVSVRGNGRGGRNQELALAAAIEMNKLHFEKNVLLLSAGTDGQDGPTPAAGACAFPGLVTMATAQNLDATSYLDNNDSFSFYSQFEEGRYLVNTGLTGTNVMDMQVLLAS